MRSPSRLSQHHERDQVLLPYFVAVQKTPEGEINWIMETKGREFENVAHKGASIMEWCQKISTQTGQVWRYLKVPQREFEASKAKTLGDLTRELGKNQPGLFSLK